MYVKLLYLNMNDCMSTAVLTPNGSMYCYLYRLILWSVFLLSGYYVRLAAAFVL